MSEDDVGFLYKTMIERDPNKRRVKPVETAHASLLDFDLGESSDDSDFRIEDHCDESDDDSVDSNDAGKGDDDDDDDDDEDESSDSDASLKESNKKNGGSAAFGDLMQSANEQNLQGIDLGEKLSKMLICCGCLGDRTDDVNEIVECDGCGITVHEGCYGISDVDSFSSADSLSQSAPWFCEACSAGVEDPDCELCPNKGGIFKETDAGKWVHLVCALYVPGVAFGEVDRLSSVTLFEMPYSKWGAKTCSLCEDLRYAVTGVCIECDAGMCHTYFHVTCAQKEGLLSETHSEEVDQADPFYAHCKLHSDKTLIRKRRKNWLTLQLRAKYRLELLNQPEYKNTDEFQRIQRKLAKHRQKYLLHKSSKPPPWVPTQKMPRLLNTSASAVRNFKKKAELMGIDTEVEEAQEAQIASLVDIRKKWHISPAFSVEFVSYCIDRISRAASMKNKLEEFLQSNKNLLEEQKKLDKKYDDVMKNNEEQMQIFNKHKEKIELYHKVLQALSYNKTLPSVHELAKPKTPLPIQTSTPSIIALKKGMNAMQASKNLNHVCDQVLDQNHIAGITIRHQCGICRRSNDQHLLAKCDTCHLYYHLSCLTPPLTRMPKKTKLFGWQCSECDKESSGSEIEQIDTSAPRRLRHFKEDLNLSNSINEEVQIHKPQNSITSVKKIPVIQNNHEDAAIHIVQHMPKVTIKPIVPDTKPERMEIDKITDEKDQNNHSFNDSSLSFRKSSPEYRMASPDAIPPIPISGRSGKKRRREKHKRYTPDPITGVKQRKHKHKRKSLDTENTQTNGSPEVPRRITIKIKPIPLPDGKQPSETSPQLFVASSTTTEITPPKEFKKSKTVPKLLLPSPPSSRPAVTDNGMPSIITTPLSSSITNNKIPPMNKKIRVETSTDCIICNSSGTSQNLVMCDECKKGYHFTCLDPPVKKSPKRRGYSWHCADCDPTDLEN